MADWKSPVVTSWSNQQSRPAVLLQLSFKPFSAFHQEHLPSFKILTGVISRRPVNYCDFTHQVSCKSNFASVDQNCLIQCTTKRRTGEILIFSFQTLSDGTYYLRISTKFRHKRSRNMRKSMKINQGQCECPAPHRGLHEFLGNSTLPTTYPVAILCR